MNFRPCNKNTAKSTVYKFTTVPRNQTMFCMFNFYSVTLGLGSTDLAQTVKRKMLWYLTLSPIKVLGMLNIILYFTICGMEKRIKHHQQCLGVVTNVPRCVILCNVMFCLREQFLTWHQIRRIHR